MTSKAYRENYALIDWTNTPHWQPQSRTQESGGPTFMPDIKEFVSPIDGSVISSRSVLRDHERRHGVRQVGDLKRPEDFDNSALRRETGHAAEQRLERAYRIALERSGL